jgi:molybdopterin-containing oxidoreductase family iron-sulfur binding subunit
MNTRKDLDSKLSILTESLGETHGKRYWRSLDELANTAEFQELMRGEFPEQADVWPESLSRRQFLTVMGASLALAGLGGCSVKPAPMSKIVPYVRPPRDIVPGEPLFFATTMPFAGSAVGLLVESHMGRPTKIEGNPNHPASLGATSLFNQASILTLYDPDRSQSVTYLGRPRTWEQATSALLAAIEQESKRGGAGVRILSESVISPALAEQKHALAKALPQAKWHVWEPVNRDAHFEATRMAFGEPLDCRHDFSKADVVLSLDADFLSCGPAHLQSVSQFMSRRRVRTSATGAPQAQMNRLYAVETSVTSTGAKADHRFALPAGQIESFARLIAAKLGVATQGSGDAARQKWAAAVAKDLDAHRGRCLIVAGDRQPASVHLLAHALNHRLDNVGKTISYQAPIDDQPDNRTQSLRALTEDMAAGRVATLIVLGSNPVYNAPADIGFTDSFQKVPLRVHMGLYQDETARSCHWHLPEAHFLEAWGDARTFDGTASIVQPLIEPLYGGRSPLELVAFLATRKEAAGDELVRAYWQKSWPAPRAGESFSDAWQIALHDGVIRESALPTRSVALRDDWQRHLPAGSSAETQGEPTPTEQLELVFQPDPTIYDGTFANNGWLQELPKPLTKLTWDNAAIMSPATASRLGVGVGTYAHGGEHGGYTMPVIELSLDGRSVHAPVWIMPGHADGSITVSLGYGRTAAGRVGGDRDHSVGFDAYALRTAARPWFASNLQVRTIDEKYLLACTQQHQLMESREVVRSASLKEYQQKPEFAAERLKEIEHGESERAPEPLNFYAPVNYDPPVHKWGMVIDLTTCVGCKACVVACQAENNIPVVGKTQVAAGREMHWLRIDRYLSGTVDRPSEFHFQPIPCMHCEQAPCEYVCPVAATVHSAEGLNDMVYNRCVGTRFCSNNCPYKVRRFNFLHYADYETATLRLQYNPDVTVRSRGVMEKCSYCVQRIRKAEIDSLREERGIRDGEVLTACQAACPAQAIVFGDLNDSNSTVAKWRSSPLNYGLLAELNTQPRTTYLASLRNPNPELEEG